MISQAVKKTRPIINKVVSKYDNESVLRKFIQFHFDVPVTLTERLLRQKKIWVVRSDSSRIKRLDSKYPVATGDTVYIDYEFETRKPKDEILQDALLFPPKVKEDQDRLLKSLVYKDDDILVLNKPSGLAMHGGTKNSTHLQSFFSALRFGASENPLIVHRLDKQASGVCILARNRYSAAKLAEMFARSSDPGKLKLEALPSVDAFGNIVQHGNTLDYLENDEPCTHTSDLQVEKTYWAILTGIPEKFKGKIDKHLFVPPESGIDISGADLDGFDMPSAYDITVTHPDRISPVHRHFVKRAITHYEVIETIGRRGCFIRLKPETGRKHQLRVHCSKILKCPMLGDMRYGESSFLKLHNKGWGQSLDFSKYSGLKSLESGIPLFLHLRQVRIKNYFSKLGNGAEGIPDLGQRKLVAKECLSQDGNDLVLTAGLSQLWKNLLRSCHINYSIKA